MTEDTRIATHLRSLQANDWKRFFGLLPEIGQTTHFFIEQETQYDENGRMLLGATDSPEIVYRTGQVLYDLGLVPPFEWMAWTEGQAMLDDPDTAY